MLYSIIDCGIKDNMEIDGIKYHSTINCTNAKKRQEN